MSYQVLPLVGPAAQNVLSTYTKLLLGISLLPQYAAKPYEQFFEELDDWDDEQVEFLIRLAVRTVALDAEELMSLFRFATDENGVSFSRVNISNLSLEEIYEVLTAVCLEVSKIKVTMVTKEEKKKSVTSQSISEQPS